MYHLTAYLIYRPGSIGIFPKDVESSQINFGNHQMFVQPASKFGEKFVASVFYTLCHNPKCKVSRALNVDWP